MKNGRATHLCALAILAALGHAALATASPAPERVWIDTDASCGGGSYTDVDDCFAIAELLSSPVVEVIGVSTVFGNVREASARRLADALLMKLKSDGHRRPPLYAGASRSRSGESPASRALQRALAERPLTIVALGPLTNLAVALRDRTDLISNVREIVAVMGKKEGHVFHPAEGSTRGWFHHGPIFPDLNVSNDPEAVADVLRTGAPLTLAPYTLSRQFTLGQTQLDIMTAKGGTASWLALRSKGWLNFWRSSVGREGFYPFDLVAAVYVLRRAEFHCENRIAEVRPDRRVGMAGGGPLSLLVKAGPMNGAAAVRWCTQGPANLISRLGILQL